MDEWMRTQLAAGLPAFRGSAVAGTVVVNQDLLNELLGRWLAAQRGARGASADVVDMSQLVPFLKQAAVRAEDGKLLIDFQVSV